MTTTLTATRVATLPRVNLLPPEIEEQRRLRKLQAGLGLGVLAAAGVVGLLVLGAVGQVNDAQDELDSSKARGTALEAEAAKFAEVPAVYAQVEAAEAQLSQAMGKEVRWSYFLNDLSLRTPSKVWLTQMSVTQEVDAVAAATPTTPEAAVMTPGIGNVTFSGKGFTHNDVAAWLDALAKQKGLTQPYFTSSTVEDIGSEQAVTFESQATITEESLSGRFTQKAGS
jgi:Tfp pilus assembly protein PilN